jgi:serine/threonine protein kinase
MQPGERVAGRFEIVGETARGGMGTVFRARDRRDRRDVALKVLRVDAADLRARFAREAAILAGLAHPHIVEYISHGATPDGLDYLVMAWVDGETLGQRLARDGLDAGAAIAIAIQLCRALAALHGRGVVHRDLKPSNIMLGGDPARVVLVDLGIARRAGDAGLTRTGAVVGTAGYLAPEQVRRGGEVDGRTDLFALGCVLHECLTGRATFIADSSRTLRAKVLLHDPPALRAIDPTVPPALDALVSALLARHPGQRPATAAAVEHALVALGPLGGPLCRGLPRDAVSTVSAAGTERAIARNPAPLCGIMISHPEPWPFPEPPAHSEDPEDPEDRDAFAVFDGGAALVIAAAPDAAVRRALAIAHALPGASVVVAPGESRDGCLDRCARLLAELELAGQVSGAAIAGVWIDRGAGEQLAPPFRLTTTAGQLRITEEP